MGLLSRDKKPTSQKYATAEEYWQAESPLAKKINGPSSATTKAETAKINAEIRRTQANVKLLNAQKKGITQREKRIQNIDTRQITQVISKEQGMLQELFGGRRTFGTGQNLPKVEGVLITGNGLLNNGDRERRTGKMFGLRS